MFKVGKSLFETNSWSKHCVSIRGNKRLDKSDLLICSKNNKVESKFSEFGWEIKSYTSQETKLSYLLTLIAGINNKENNLCPFYELKDFKDVENVIKEYCKCDGIDVGEEPKIRKYRYCDKEYLYYDIDGCIDYQSYEYESLQNFLEYWDVTIKEFIFSPNVWLKMDDGNH